MLSSVQKALIRLQELLDEGIEENMDTRLFCLEGDIVTCDMLEISWFPRTDSREGELMGDREACCMSVKNLPMGLNWATALK